MKEDELEEYFFTDENIISQTSALIEDKDGNATNGIWLTIEDEGRKVDIILEREEIEACLKYLNKDWEIHKNLTQTKR